MTKTIAFQVPGLQRGRLQHDAQCDQDDEVKGRRLTSQAFAGESHEND